MPGIDLRVYNQVQSPNKACQSKSKPDHTHHPLELIHGFAQKIDPYRNSPRMTEAVAWIWGYWSKSQYGTPKKAWEWLETEFLLW